MNQLEWNLLKLMEECSEVQKAASKQMLFGKHGESTSDIGLKNHEALRGEIMDVLICIQMLGEAGQIDPINPEDLPIYRLSKEHKIRVNRAKARELGTLT